MAVSFLSLFLKALALPLSPDYWKRLLSGLKEIWRAVVAVLCRVAKGEWHGKRKPARTGCCIDLPPDVYKRADPLIYSQYYLMAHGLAVTWDNPDIDIFDGGALVTGQLKPKHRYRVRVRVWNGSYDAPALGAGVELSYLSFGAQTVSNAISAQSVALGAKGAFNCPAFAEFDWETPPAGGHYCLQARLLWTDDANPDNNLGQKNVTVEAAHSPARFAFTVRNDASVPRRFTLEADGYGLPDLPRCADDPTGGERPKTRLQESRARWDKALRQQAYGHFPVPDDWTVEISPAEFGLDARQERQVDVAIEPKNPAFRGERTFNIHVFAAGERGAKTLAGGVSLRAAKA